MGVKLEQLNPPLFLYFWFIRHFDAAQPKVPAPTKVKEG